MTPLSYRIYTTSFAAVILLLTACAPMPPKPQRTQLQIREFQTRSYDNTKGQSVRVMKAVIDVLQDEGFIIKNADRDLGFITAAKEVDVEDPWASAFAYLGANNGQPRYSKNAITEASVNITEFGKQVKVRAIFQRKVLDNLGGTMGVQQLEDPRFYQDFFSKVDKGVFIEKQSI
ncbi:MAG: hypothetical protein GX589_00925 [Deltaproteobacteria bacterium]|nr:hypothetical protein [Deltaproteobacteria bacterium]